MNRSERRREKKRLIVAATAAREPQAFALQIKFTGLFGKLVILLWKAGLVKVEAAVHAGREGVPA